MSYIGNSPTQVAFVTDQFNGTGSQVAFTMSVAPANPASALVAVSGVLQDPSTYGVSGTTLTFTQAPPVGTGNISVRYLGIPASNVTTTAYRTVTEFTATAGQTTFTPASYVAGYINVYRNGVRLGNADYTATNGTTVVLAVGANSGDLVSTESFYVSSVIGAIPATPGAVTTTYIGSAQVTPTQLSQPLTLGTSQASTSGTSIDFTGIPSWVKRITVMYAGVSTNNTSDQWLRLGTSGGFATSGYVGYNVRLASASNSYNALSSAFILTAGGALASELFQGNIVITNQTGNTWTVAGQLTGSANTGNFNNVAGYITLSGVLTQIRLTSATPDTFDAGTINILYE